MMRRVLTVAGAISFFAASVFVAAWAQTGGLPSVPSVVVQVQGAPGPTGPQGPAGSTPSASALGCSSGTCADATAIPQPAGTVPLGATPTGNVGTSHTYVPSDATQPGLSRSTTVVTASDGTFSVSWATPLVSASPVINLIPINTSSTSAALCNIASRSSSAATGKCWMMNQNALTLAIVTTGITLGPVPAASGLSVMVFAREPTQ